MYTPHPRYHNRPPVIETPSYSKANTKAFWIAAAMFAALSLFVGAKSDGFLEADACTHYQFARWCWQQPAYLVNVWGRPFCTAIYAVPALLANRTGTKITALLIALFTALLTWQIAKLQQFKWPALAGIFLLAQPLVFLHSFNELTELPFALLVAAAFLMYCQKRWWALGCIAGLMPLARPEGFGFILLAAAALIRYRRFLWLPLLILPLIVWSLAGSHIEPSGGAWWRWLPAHWPYAPHSAYHAGSPFQFLAALPVITGPFLFPFLILGIWQNLSARPAPGESSASSEISPSPSIPACGEQSRTGEGGAEVDGMETNSQGKKALTLTLSRRTARGDKGLAMMAGNWIVALLPLAVLVGHSLLYWRGAMASNGEIRYMLAVAPFWALLAARGWEWLFRKLDWQRPFLAAGAASLLPVIANFIYPVLPIHFDPNWQHAHQLVYFYEHTDLHNDYPRILAAHPGISYFLNVSPTDPQQMLQWDRHSVDSAPPGVVLIWDDVYSLFNSDANLIITQKQIAQAGWKLIRIDEDPYRHRWAIYVSRPVAQAGHS